MVAFQLQETSRVIVRESLCPAQPKIATTWPFTEKFLLTLDSHKCLQVERCWHVPKP